MTPIFFTIDEMMALSAIASATTIIANIFVVVTICVIIHRRR